MFLWETLRVKAVGDRRGAESFLLDLKNTNCSPPWISKLGGLCRGRLGPRCPSEPGHSATSQPVCEPKRHPTSHNSEGVPRDKVSHVDAPPPGIRRGRHAGQHPRAVSPGRRTCDRGSGTQPKPYYGRAGPAPKPYDESSKLDPTMEGHS